MISGDSNGLLRDEPSVLLTMNICRVRRFCQTALSSVDGARKIIIRRFTLRRGVRVRSGVQLTVGLFTDPFGSIVSRNSVAVN